MKQVLSQRGGSMVEFALILPILIILVFGIIEFGILIYNQQVLTNAAREGARRGIVQDTPRIQASEINQTVQDYAAAHLITFSTTKAAPAVEVKFSTLGNPSFFSTGVCQSFADNLRVNVTYNYSFMVIPNFITGIDKPYPMASVSVMKCE